MTTLGGPVFPYIASSAADYIDYGVLNIVTYQQVTSTALDVVNQWIVNNYADISSILINLENTSAGTTLLNNYNTAKTNLLESIQFIPIYGQSANQFQSLIGSTQIVFFLSYNSLIGWTLSISNSEAILINGIMLLPGVNLIEGYNLNISTNNLFVVDLADNNSNLVTAWGNGVLSTVKPLSFLFYFDNDYLTAFQTAINEILGPRDLHFTIDELNYTIN